MTSRHYRNDLAQFGVLPWGSDLFVNSERSRGILGTAAAIAIGLGSAAASAATNIYATKKAGGINERAIAAQQASEAAALKVEQEALQKQQEAQQRQLAADAASQQRALELEERRRVDTQTRFEAQRLAEAEARKQYYTFEDQRWRDYVAAHSPSWAVGQRAYGSLADLLNLPRGTTGLAPGPSTAPTATPTFAGPVAGGALPVSGGGSLADFLPESMRSYVPAGTTVPPAGSTSSVPGAPGSGSLSNRGRAILARRMPRVDMPTGSNPLTLAKLMEWAQMASSGGVNLKGGIPVPRPAMR